MISKEKLSQATEKYLEEEGYKPYIEQAFKDGAAWEQCLPYNEKTAKLLGTKDDYTDD